ncbi:GNAT family N-acetyltransferase [Candidatus Entotheonella serta]|nr:GNAT family N-acetyltransferase [Candidatus Entotheonella serta]
MSNRPIIRDAERRDIPEITSIYAIQVREGLASFELQPPSEAEMAQRLCHIQEAGLPYLVAEVEQRIAGYTYASYYRPRPAYCHTVENSVYVASWAQQRGVGRMLLAELIERCEAVGKRQMIAVIGDSGNVASIALHEAAGFRHVGVLQSVGFKHDQWVDSVLMQRRFRAGRQSQAGCAKQRPPACGQR